MYLKYRIPTSPTRRQALKLNQKVTVKVMGRGHSPQAHIPLYKADTGAAPPAKKSPAPPPKTIPKPPRPTNPGKSMEEALGMLKNKFWEVGICAFANHLPYTKKPLSHPCFAGCVSKYKARPLITCRWHGLVPSDVFKFL